MLGMRGRLKSSVKRIELTFACQSTFFNVFEDPEQLQDKMMRQNRRVDVTHVRYFVSRCEQGKPLQSQDAQNLPNRHKVVQSSRRVSHHAAGIIVFLRTQHPKLLHAVS